jgi:hypothetical protein
LGQAVRLLAVLLHPLAHEARLALKLLPLTVRLRFNRKCLTGKWKAKNHFVKLD